MRPRVQWALFCRDLAVNDLGLTALSDLVHVLTVDPGTAQLWLVASIEGAPNSQVPLTLRLTFPGTSPVALPEQAIAFGSDGYAELKVRLPPVPLSVAGTFSVDLLLGDDRRPVERVSVKILKA